MKKVLDTPAKIDYIERVRGRKKPSPSLKTKEKKVRILLTSPNRQTTLRG
jgi:hypothetical protein